MTAVQVIGDRDTVLAFALGGVPGQVVASAEEARAALERVVRGAETDGGRRHPTLLLVPHGVAEGLRADLDRLVLDASAPLVLELPGFGEPGGADPVARFVARVLGLRR